MSSLIDPSPQWQQPHVCECCLASTQGYFKDTATEYFYMGRKEVYRDMLRNVLNITIKSGQGEHRICDPCIEKLRDAFNFKKQVLQSQMALNENSGIEEKPRKFIIKLEEFSTCPDDSIDDLDAFEAEERGPGLVIKSEQLPAQTAGKTRLGQKDKTAGSSAPGKEKIMRRQGFKLKEKSISRIKAALNIKQDPECDSGMKEVYMKDTTLQLILNSNLVIFNWFKNKFRCFYCRDMFLDPELLRAHASAHTRAEVTDKILGFNSKYYYRADITDLECSICREPLQTIDALTDHLISAHDVNIQIKECFLMPFRLKESACQLCQEEFKSFVLLDHHMSSHYNKYICDTCGKSFRQKHSLKTHMNRTHVKKVFECKPCHVTFETFYKKRRHDTVKHKLAYNNVCPHCPEKFKHYIARMWHLIRAHGHEKPEFKCSHCDKTYITNALLRSHIRKVHIRERNFDCSVCSNKYMRRCELSEHMKSHIQARDFVCTYCGKGFFRKRNLSEHLAIHVEEFRHVCPGCGKTFAQKYNMNSHWKRCQDSNKK